MGATCAPLKDANRMLSNSKLMARPILIEERDLLFFLHEC